MNQTTHVFDLANELLHFDAGGKGQAIAADLLWSLPPDEIEKRAGHILVGAFEFDADWATWEMHPHGDELACLLAGSADLVLRCEGKESVVALKAGDSVLIPQGAWHTARTTTACKLLLVTYGRGTQIKPREEMEQH